VQPKYIVGIHERHPTRERKHKSINSMKLENRGHPNLIRIANVF
jgi:hypothetical protein